MKYVIYIDYLATMTYEYRPMEAKTLKEAIIEADNIFNPDKMYLIKIMEKTGKAKKVEKGLKSQAYTNIMTKRSTKWLNAETDHVVNYFTSKFGNWFEIA